MDKLYVIVGPTGVGKTKFSIELAKIVGGEIINGDAFQIYKELNIGTAKIKSDEMENISHHLFDIISITESFSVEKYQRIVREKIEEIWSRNNVAIIVGGSGLYIRSVLYNYEFGKEILIDLSHYTKEELYHELIKLDVEFAKTIHPNNRVRVERAIKRFGHIKPVDKMIYECKILGITTNRDHLYEIINNRVDTMFDQGLDKEVDDLINNGGNFEFQALKAIGYQEFKYYYNNELSLEDVKDLIKRNSRRYAKKQYTWFNNQMEIEWIDVDNLNEYLVQLKTSL